MCPSLAQAVGAAYRDKDKLVPTVARHLIKATGDEDRREDCIHPSEISHGGWCPRATYYRISGVVPEPSPRNIVFEMVFERGHDSHRKWQTWFWEIGILNGVFVCTWCGLHWWDKSPHECPRCEVGIDQLRYGEVPVINEEHLIFGHADGIVDKDDGSDVPIEIKTIGTGTVRIEAPQLMKQYTYTHTDVDGDVHTGVDWPLLWSRIRRPFTSHLRQGMIYLFCMDRKEIIFIYEPKFVTAYPKEFEIKFNSELIADVLDDCKKVRVALDKQRAPRRPMWAEQTHPSCKECGYRRTCYGLA